MYALFDAHFCVLIQNGSSFLISEYAQLRFCVSSPARKGFIDGEGGHNY